MQSPLAHQSRQHRVVATRDDAPDVMRRRPHPGGVVRPRLLGPLIEDMASLAVLVAPAGYGKSTLLAQWEAADPRPFAAAALTEADADPDQLVRTVAEALGYVAPMPTDAVAGRVLRALSTNPPMVLALDGAHVLRTRSVRPLLTALAEAMGPGSTLALAGRGEPPLALARRRAADGLVELRAAELALTRSETAIVLELAGLDLTPYMVDRLHDLTLGWPAALRLVARELHGERDLAGAVAALSGEDHALAAYVRDEILAPLGARDRELLTHTAPLARLTGAACDAVAGRAGTAARLRALADGGVPLIATDRGHLEFRHHPLVAQALRAELRAAHPALERDLHHRASAFFEGERDPDAAIHHAAAAQDAERVAALLAPRACRYVAGGRALDVERWLAMLPEEDVAAHAPLAVAGALTRLVRADGPATERRLADADRALRRGRGAAEQRAAIAVLRAAGAGDGVEHMAHVAAQQGAQAPGDGPWRSFACLLEGSARLLAGADAEAQALLAEGARRGAADAPAVRMLCLAEMALLALEADRRADAAALADAARALARTGGIGGYPVTALALAATALAQAEGGHADVARSEAQDAMRLLSQLADGPPWFCALVRVTLARTWLHLGDTFTARQLLSAASRHARRTTGAVALTRWIDAGWVEADEHAAEATGHPGALTIAELRVLRFLPSHLALREIAARLHVSTNTVKTQARGIYRKLDVGSRSEAVTRARAIGLLEA